MMSLRKVFVLMVLLIHFHDALAVMRRTTFDVRKLGAFADGKNDDSAILLRAWRSACEQGGFSRVLVPPGRYKVFPVKFVGPCKGPIEFKVQGVLIASPSPVTLNFDHWITFRYVNGLTIRGGGSFYGQGPSAWPYNDCTRNPSCRSLPISLRFDFVTNALIRSIKSINSKNFHINVFACHNVKFFRVKIIAPTDSPNTDGIHIGSSTHIGIHESLISTGDDCISLGPGSKYIDISRIRCGPGHGISIGSLGKYPKEEDVVGVRVWNCTLSGTDNGLRIKTWGSPLRSRAYNFTYEDVVMNNVYNPILIDQSYCPSGGCNRQAASHVQVEDVWFNNIRGTTISKVAVSLLCSPVMPCKNVNLKDISLRYSGKEGGRAQSSCANVWGSAFASDSPPSCI